MAKVAKVAKLATDLAKEGLVYVRIFLDGTVVEYLIKEK